ncbi:MAG: UdgX family uracil-DNA binding protein [Anaerolineae bacterium]|nr:UdgX family uracil-DNA binding protein [Phycisphaerae bacterium]
MRQIRIRRHFDSFRKAARSLLSNGVAPDDVAWIDSDEVTLLSDDSLASIAAPIIVSSQFFAVCRLASCHRDRARWPLMYRLLWRLSHGEKNLLDIVVDEDVHNLLAMEKAVRRDRHKMTAFVRFRRVERDGAEHFIAWHRPDHYIVELTASFFRDRFATMNWTILTPDDSVSWDGRSLCFAPGVPATAAPQGDVLEELWATYYASTFNPARIKLKAMCKEMPRKHWATMPETKLIPDLLRDAPRRVEEMVKRNSRTASKVESSQQVHDFVPLDKCKTTGSADDFLPEKLSLPQLREAAKSCKGCDLYCNATQVVFGEGPAGATVMFVGEQPGDQEDLQGKPFVGPSGQLLNGVLEEVGIDRRHDVYVTNAVKHFKYEQRGKRRVHSTPNARESAACRPWLEAEVQVVKPQVVVCLGATAAKSLLGAGFRVTKQRGEMITDTKWAPLVTATYHPSAILRQPDEESRKRVIGEFRDDLVKVAKQIKALRAKGIDKRESWSEHAARFPGAFGIA